MKDSQRTVSDVMTRTVVAVGRDAPFKEIVTTLVRWKVTAVPVVEEEGHVVGVVSEADLLAKQEVKGDRDPSRREQMSMMEDLLKAGGGTAEEVMTTPAVTVGTDATVAEAARLMARRRVKRLPVVDGEGRLAGIVSRGDLLKVYLRGDEDIAREVREELAEHIFAHEEPTVTVTVVEGVVTLTGTIANTALIPVAARLIRAVEGVVNVEIKLTGHAAARPATPVAGPRP